MVFDHSGAEVARHQLEHTQIMPRPGWVEHNPVEIWERTSAVIKTVLNTENLRTTDLAALGLTNQRETTLVWKRRIGRRARDRCHQRQPHHADEPPDAGLGRRAARLLHRPPADAAADRAVVG